MVKIFDVMVCTLQLYLLKTVTSSQRMINATDLQFPSYAEVLLCEHGTCLHRCGGAILNAQVIITACHCVANISTSGKIVRVDLKKILVVAGSESPNKQMVGAKEIVMDSRCAYRKTMEHDTAVIALKKNLVFNKKVQPIMIPSGDDYDILLELYKLASGATQCITMGSKGNQEEEDKFEDDQERRRILEEVERNVGNNASSTASIVTGQVRLITSKTCEGLFCDLGYENLCSHNFQGLGQICVLPEGSGSCHTDGGSPMICKGKIFGVGSWGPKCAKNYPLVYAHISSVPKMLKVLQNKTGIPHAKQRRSIASFNFSSFIRIMMGLFLITYIRQR